MPCRSPASRTRVTPQARACAALRRAASVSASTGCFRCSERSFASVGAPFEALLLPASPLADARALRRPQRVWQG